METEAQKQLNWEIYTSRVEPAILSPIGRNASGPRYASLRETTDVQLLKNTLRLIQEESQKTGNEQVIMPWINVPYGTIRGYGIYCLQEAQAIKDKAKQEGWGFPKPGPIYSRTILEEWIMFIEHPEPTGIESRV
jgi:hypothetical protein